MSELRANTISDAAGTGPVALTGQSAAKFIATYNLSTGSPVELYSVNISSYTDNGVGLVTLNYTNNMADSNYALAGLSAPPFGITTAESYCHPTNVGAIITSSVDLMTGFTNAGSDGDRDYDYNSQMGFGDLA